MWKRMELKHDLANLDYHNNSHILLIDKYIYTNITQLS